ncbi:MAG TPA: RluA family pseudouridine synthase [Candidatus Babeliales bacterium]|nr:RluA family pseudouridine synthase [Candidatus Babeliales bacterium]
MRFSMIKHGHIPPESTFSFTVPENSIPCRIDRYITELFPDYSRSYFQRIIDAGGIIINGIQAKKPSTLVYSTNTVTIHFPPERVVKTENLIDKTLKVSILATTNHFMIIHKPAHLLVHAPSTTSTAITLADWIRHYHGDIRSVGLSARPGIIHRLDKETSGIMIITRTDYAHNIIGCLFRNRKINKTYKAIVAGHPEKEGTITLAIGRDPINRIKMAAFHEENISADGTIGTTRVRHAKTDYKVLEYFDNASLIEVKPTTGRTHQIRVHMAALGHPIIGDQLYGKKSSLIDRQALHAESLSFTFEETTYSFSNEIPDDFQQLLNSLRGCPTQTK